MWNYCHRNLKTKEEFIYSAFPFPSHSVQYKTTYIPLIRLMTSHNAYSKALPQSTTAKHLHKSYPHRTIPYTICAPIHGGDAEEKEAKEPRKQVSCSCTVHAFTAELHINLVQKYCSTWLEHKRRMSVGRKCLESKDCRSKP